MFGRYEKHDNSINKHAFYEIISTPDNSKVRVAWGRIGSKGSSQIISQSEASDRIRKKQADGYEFYSSITQAIMPNVPSVPTEQRQAIEAIEKSRAERIKKKSEEFNMNDWLTK